MDSKNKKQKKRFCCTFSGCKYCAARLSTLEQHMAIHTKTKLYLCSNCGKSFAQLSGLQSHQRSCFHEQGYLCDVCGAKFNYLQSMKSHRLLHTGEKPYECTDCGAKFTDPRNLKRHRRIHDNLYPYKCSQCDKRFRHSNSLKAHTNTHERKKTSDEFDFQLAVPSNKAMSAQNTTMCQDEKLGVKETSSVQDMEPVPAQDVYLACNTSTSGRNARRKQPYRCLRCDKQFRHYHSLKAHTNTHEMEDKSNNQIIATMSSTSVLNNITENCKADDLDIKPCSSVQGLEVISEQNLCNTCNSGCDSTGSICCDQPAVSTCGNNTSRQHSQSHLQNKSAKSLSTVDGIKIENTLGHNPDINHESSLKPEQDFTVSTNSMP